MDIRHAHEKLNIFMPVQGRRKEIKVVRSGISCDKNNWASEASPTLGCSIEISRDIYICCRWYVSYVKLTA